MSGYSDGRAVEYAVIDDLKANGYVHMRGASSKGFCDVVAIKPGEALFVNVKRTTPPGPAERADLLRVAGFIGAVPLVALKPLRQGLEYRLLTGAGPRDWVPWSPDAFGEAS